MKRALLFIFLFSFSIIVKSQIAWCDSGATWHYSYDKFAATGTVTMTVIGSQVINGVTTKKIKKYLYYYDQMFNTYNGYTIGYEYTYTNNNVIYLYNKNQMTNVITFDTLCDFNAKIGDKWRATHRVGFGECDTGIVTVLDTGRKVINGFSLKWVYVDHSLQVGYPYKDTIYERIGYAKHYMFPSDKCMMSIDAHEGGWFMCYSDSIFPRYKGWSSCGLAIDVNENIATREINFYPNPANNLLHFENLPINEKVNYNIYALDGKIVQQGIITASHIGISSIENGVYFLEINVEGKSKKYKVVKTN